MLLLYQDLQVYKRIPGPDQKYKGFCGCVSEGGGGGGGGREEEEDKMDEGCVCLPLF